MSLSSYYHTLAGMAEAFEDLDIPIFDLSIFIDEIKGLLEVCEQHGQSPILAARKRAERKHVRSKWDFSAGPRSWGQAKNRYPLALSRRVMTRFYGGKPHIRERS